MGQDTLIEKENMLQNNGGFCSRERWTLYSYIWEMNSKIYYTNGQDEFLDTGLFLAVVYFFNFLSYWFHDAVTLYNYSLLLRSIRVFMDLKNDIHRSLKASVNIDF